MSTALTLANIGAKLPQKPVTLDQKLTSVDRYVWLGFMTLLFLVGGMGGWAATTNLAGAVLAPGTIVVASNVKKIQHPTGGVVGKIFVKNGDHVKGGDVLVRLDETVTRAQLQIITKQMDELAGRQVRLKAEIEDAKTLAFPNDLLNRVSEPAVAAIVTGEKNLFESRLSTRDAQKKQLSERIAGYEQEVAGLDNQAQAKKSEIEIITKELAGLEQLEAKQLVTTNRINSLRREAVRLEGERAQLHASAGSSKGHIAETEAQRLAIDREAKSEVAKDLRETEGKLVELAERRTAAEDQLRRIDLKAPVDGVVHQMTVFTVGGVINTAEPLMLIVPEGDRLVVEAKIAPQDIDQARSHEEATIRLSAFNQRTTPTIRGRVLSISADLTHDQQQNIAYYVARIEIPDEELQKLEGQKLVPGMPADVQIATTARTALSYLMRPMEDAFAKAFKER